MSEEVLPRKLGEGLVPESSPTLIETNKQKREGLILVCLVAVGSSNRSSGQYCYTAILKSLEGDIFGSRSSSTVDSGTDAFEATTALGASFKAIDAKGDVIENNDGVASSEQITLTGYSDGPYSTKMLCTIDMLPL
jgi:hypothetical protein